MNIKILQGQQRVLKFKTKATLQHQFIVKVQVVVRLVNQIEFEVLYHVIVKNVFVKHREKRQPDTFTNFVFGCCLFFPDLVNKDFGLWLVLVGFSCKPLEIWKIDLIQIHRKADAIHVNKRHLAVDKIHYLTLLS